MSPPRPGASHLALLTLIAISLIPTATSADVIFRLKTRMGKIDIALFTDFVQGEPTRLAVNFQDYAAQGLFNKSIIHYAHPGFVIQGGRFVHRGGEFSEVIERLPVTGGPTFALEKGTIALGRPRNSPD
ncbi:MAG: peptidylprolyl isomerase, partial [Proteobacteria bacterium]|nr:peptidylprolyl isomerase [Pseudomonadota bacterium]